METRNSTEIPHIKQQPLPQLLGARCPTKGDVFRHFYYLRYVENQPVLQAQQNAVKAATSFWTSAGITPKKEEYAVNDLAKLFIEFKVLFSDSSNERKIMTENGKSHICET